ncbi:hypothetical protein ACWGID_27250 [Kribbella sp. NPDC054772]
MTEHPGEQFPPGVDPDVEPGFDPEQSEQIHTHPDYDTEPGAQDAAEHVDPAAVEFGPEFARAPGEEYEHSFEAGSAEDPTYEETGSDEESAYQEESGEGGHPLVEQTMGRLDELRDRPVSEHADVYADLHETLQSALVEADADQGDRG